MTEIEGLDNLIIRCGSCGNKMKCTARYGNLYDYNCPQHGTIEIEVGA